MIYYILLLTMIILIIFIIYSISSINTKNNKKILTCFDKKFGCCKDNYTPKLDIAGSNCRGF